MSNPTVGGLRITLMKSILMPRERTFITLDGLRGIAALAVVTRHAPAFFAPISIILSPANNPKVFYSVGPFFESYLAVDFFFALSGFVIAHAYGERLRAGMQPGHFMTIRIVRLYPLYALALFISFCAVLSSSGGSINVRFLIIGATDFIFALFFLPSPTGFILFPLNVPAWSLFDELFVNLLYGITGRRLRTPWLLLLVGLAGSSLLFAVNARGFGFGSTRFGAMSDGWQWPGLGAGLLRATYSFFAGVLVYRAWNIWRPRKNVSPLLVLGALTIILAAYPPERYRVAFDLVVTLVVFPGLIFLGAGSTPKGLLARLFTKIGAASYGVYVLQEPIYKFIYQAVSYFSGGARTTFPWTYGVAFVAVVLSIAAIADRYMDRPVREALSARLLKSR